MSLNASSMNAPVINTGAPNFHPYNCHMAVLHWALMASGKTDQSAQQTVQAFTRDTCPHCKGVHNLIGSVPNNKFGEVFCTRAKAFAADQCQVGDVLIIPSPAQPMHSMVVVSVDGGNVGVRGYNNAGTFTGAPYMQYDPTTRMINDRNSPNANPVFLISQSDFVTTARGLSRLV